MRKVLIAVTGMMVLLYSFVAGACFAKDDYRKMAIYMLCTMSWSWCFYMNIKFKMEGR